VSAMGKVGVRELYCQEVSGSPSNLKEFHETPTRVVVGWIFHCHKKGTGKLTKHNDTLC
jgi:hypothetical protein